ncbi:MAG: RNA-binding protein [Bacteroidales bacterium]|nr:RNA-binding protein [Bacteroidales bacterium]MBN2819697.1 RNA-binding protein [Bacteroidales bacterium]
MTIYVGNVNYSMTEEDVRRIFEVLGKVDAIKIIRDKKTGKSKGFGFLDMPSKKEAMEAIKTLDGKTVGGRNLRVLRAHTNKVRVSIAV